MGTFKDSLKKWFFTNNSSAASSTARVAMLDASGNPIGSDTMDKLSSVLDALDKRVLKNNSITLLNAKGRLIVLSHPNFYTLGIIVNSDGRKSVAFFSSTQSGVTQESVVAQFTITSTPNSGANSVTIELAEPINNASFCNWAIL